MNTILTLGVLLTARQGQMKVQEFSGPGETGIRFQVRTDLSKLDPPKISPKHKWLFEYVSNSYGRQQVAADVNLDLKFRVFSQSMKDENDPAPLVGRTLIRLWDYTFRRLRFDHNKGYNNGIVDVYLCFGGEPGGEQLFDEEFENRISRRVNTIYIYQIGTFTEPIEMARELAHEYGHAVLPPVGGFQTPEDWGNGYLGEKLYMRYLMNQVVAKQLGPEDAMGATASELKQFAAKEIDPLWVPICRSGPNLKQIGGKGQKAMDAYLGLALYADLMLPPSVFSRSLKIIGSVKAVDYPESIVNTVAELPVVSVRVPVRFVGKPMWVPFPKGAKISGAEVKKRVGHWALVVPKGKSLKIFSPVSQ